MEAIQEFFHCQVCGREIKASKGVIAHHGYKRDYGYHTASCGGARYVPYEVSCERLKEVLEEVKAYTAKQAVKLQEFLDNAPETITVYEKRGAWSNPEEKTYEKPADFNPEGYGSNIPRTYANAYRNMKSDYERNIRLANLDIQSMQRRVNEWKGAAAALEASPIEVGDIVRPNTMYTPFATWKRAKVIGLHYYDRVDGNWVIDIQYMSGLGLMQTKQYMMAAWEVVLVERAAQPSDLDRALEEIERKKRLRLAEME